jgi:hypothetical protein
MGGDVPVTAARTTPRPTHDAPNSVSGLVRKRAEIAGQIEVAQIGLRRMIADLDHIDAAIRIFAPELATETIKSRPNPPQHQDRATAHAVGTYSRGLTARSTMIAGRWAGRERKVGVMSPATSRGSPSNSVSVNSEAVGPIAL